MKKTYRIRIKDKEPEDLIKYLFAPLLEKGLVEGLMLPRQTKGGGIISSLVKDLESLEGVMPISPLMLVSGAKSVSNLTFKGVKQKVGALLRPCEIRALVELVKLKQSQLDTVLIIGVDCLGTMEVASYKENSQEMKASLPKQFAKMLREGCLQEDFKIRGACLYCQYPTTEIADIQLSFIGSSDGELMVVAQSDKGLKILESLQLEEVEPSSKRENLLGQIRREKSLCWEKEKEDFTKKIKNFQYFVELFDYCQRCYNCRTSCPICYCRECVFQTLVFEHKAENYFKWANRKGSLRMPSDTILFHLTRLNHMGLSCVSCGLCESACPSGVDLLKIFKSVSEGAQEFFSYVPGDDMITPLPLTTFCEEEFEPR